MRAIGTGPVKSQVDVKSTLSRVFDLCFESVFMSPLTTPTPGRASPFQHLREGGAWLGSRPWEASIVLVMSAVVPTDGNSKIDAKSDARIDALFMVTCPFCLTVSNDLFKVTRHQSVLHGDAICGPGCWGLVDSRRFLDQ